MDIPQEKRESIAEELRQIEQIREIQRRLWAGASVRAVAQALGVSRYRVEKVRWLWSGVSVSEQVKYAAVHNMPREELVGILSKVEYVFHGYDSVVDFGYDINLDWWPLQVMVSDGLLTTEEYDAVCGSQIAITREVLARPHCDSRTCDEHELHLYVVCYGQPTLVKSRDWHAYDGARYDPDFKPYPISHYVGITKQKPAVKRLWQHAANSARHVVAVMPGTHYEESVLKAFGTCPHCDGSLDYFAENLARDHYNPLTGQVDRGDAER